MHRKRRVGTHRAHRTRHPVRSNGATRKASGRPSGRPLLRFASARSTHGPRRHLPPRRARSSSRDRPRDAPPRRSPSRCAGEWHAGRYSTAFGVVNLTPGLDVPLFRRDVVRLRTAPRSRSGRGRARRDARAGSFRIRGTLSAHGTLMAVTDDGASARATCAQVGGRRLSPRARAIVRAQRAPRRAVRAAFAWAGVGNNSVDTCNSVGIIRSHRSVQQRRDFAVESGSRGSGVESADASLRGGSRGALTPRCSAVAGGASEPY